MGTNIKHYSELEDGQRLKLRVEGGGCLITGAHEIQQDRRGFALICYVDGTSEGAPMPDLNLAALPDFIKTVARIQRAARSDADEIAYQDAIKRARALCR